MSEGIMNIRGDARRIAAEFGTPSYVVYEKILKENYEHFYDSFKKNWSKVVVAYSVKANYLPAVLSILHSAGASAEVVSGFELYVSLKAGISSDKIIFNGPSKTLKELDFAIRKGVRLINADSVSELQKINKLGKLHGRVVDVGIRVNTEETWKKFGIPLESAEEAFKYCSKLENIKLVGIHAHIGTKISSTDPYVRTVDKLLGLMRNLQKDNIIIDFLDIGGGFPARDVGLWGGVFWNSVIDSLTERLPRWKLGSLRKLLAACKTEKPVFHDAPRIGTYAERICGKLKERLREWNLPPPFLILEPGRSLVNSAFTLLVRAIDVKSFGEKWVMVDGGINLAPALESEVHRVLDITSEGKEIETVKLAGPLCFEGDILCKSAKVSSVSEGDIIEVFDVGAYSISQSNQFIKPRAGVVLVRETGEVVEVRRRERYKDMLRLDSPFFVSLGNDRKTSRTEN